MARRRIGQEALRFSGAEAGGSSLDRLAALIDWTVIEEQLGGIHAAARGGAGLATACLLQGDADRGLV
jgi:hypothetical protein